MRPPAMRSIVLWVSLFAVTSTAPAANDLSVTLERFDAGPVVVDYAAYPTPAYMANWTQWGQGTVTSSGKVYSAVGDHRGEDGNTYLYEYDPNSRVLRVVADLQQAVPVAPDEYGFGKIHGRIREGRDGRLYFTSFYGVEGPGHLDAAQCFFCYDPSNAQISVLGRIKGFGLPSSHLWSEGLLLYAEATDKMNLEARFVVFDVEAGRIRFSCAHPEFWSRDLFVDAAGNAYFNGPGRRLMRYNALTDTVTALPTRMPGNQIRRTAGPGPQGYLYGLTCSNRMLFRLDPQTGDMMELTQLERDTAALGLDPTGRFLYVIARDGPDTAMTLVRLDVSDVMRPQRQTICELATVLGPQRGSGKAYFLDVSRDGREVYVGYNANSGGVGFAVIHVEPAPTDAVTVAKRIVPGKSSSVTSRQTAQTQPTGSKSAKDQVARFEELAGRLGEREAFQAYHRRVALLDEVAAEIRRNLRVREQIALEPALAEGCGLPAQTFSAEPAAEIYHRYQADFATALAVDRLGLQPAELDLLKQAYNAVYQAAQRDVNEAAERLIRIDDTQRSAAVDLVLVLPLLTLPDAVWASQAEALLPAWAADHAGHRAAEAMALGCQRETVAWHLSRGAAGDGDAPADLAGYLRWVADGLASQGRSGEAQRVLRTVMQVAQQAGDTGAAAAEVSEEALLKMARICRDDEQYPLAAGHLKRFIETYPQSPKWPRAVLDRLLCLYRADSHQALLAEVDTYLEDDRCLRYRPQILYLAWASAYHENDSGKVDLYRERFLAKYPTHALGAHFHFAQATSLLAAGEYEQALAILKLIEEQYPDSTILWRVRLFKDELEKSLAQSH